MTTRTEQLAAHSIWTQLEAADVAIQAAMASKSTPSTARPSIDRTRKVETRIRLILESVDADLVSFSQLNELANQFANIASWVTSLSQGSDTSTNIDSYLDNVTALPNLGLAAPLPANGKAGSLIVGVRREAEAAQKDLTTMVDHTRQELASLSVQLATLDARATENSSLLESTRATSSVAVATMQETFAAETATAIKSVREESAAQLEKFETDHQGQLENAKEFLETQASDAQDLLERLRSIEQAVKATTESISDRVLSGDYGVHAGEEGKVANKLRGLAVASLVLAVAVALWAAVIASTGNITWQRFVAKTATTIVLSGLASYLASQSREHREEERRARRRHLDLRTLGPFIVDLPLEEQHQIRAEIARKAFIETSEAPAQREPILRGRLSLDSATKLIELGSSIAKK